MKWIWDNIFFDGCFTVPNEGRGGGLALLWKGVNIWVDSFSKYHIDSIIHGGSVQAWRLIGFYGEPDTSLRSEGWNMLRMLGLKLQLPWCYFGYFNELLEVHDKRGGPPRAHHLLQNFREALDHCGFGSLWLYGLRLFRR